MARRKTVSTGSTAVLTAEKTVNFEDAKAAVDNIESIVAAMSDVTVASDLNTSKKHVALEQLYIIREYIDKENRLQDSKSITDESGVHGLRFYNNKLQIRDSNGKWSDIVFGSDGSGGDSCGLENVTIAEDNDISDLFNPDS